MSILRVRHLHHGGHQVRRGLPIGALCCSASRGHLFQLGRHAEVGACASCVYDSEACSVRGVGAESRTPIAPKSSTRLETSSAAAVPPGTEASSRLDGPSSSMPAACPFQHRATMAIVQISAALGNVLRGVGRKSAHTLLEVVRRVAGRKVHPQRERRFWQCQR